MLFESNLIIEPIKKALKEEGYSNPTPIQSQSIPILLEGKDILGVAQTGTGKTAAFAIPILQGLSGQSTVKRSQRTIQALILAPTRELAIQIHESFKTYGKHLNLKSAVIFGGVSQKPQTDALALGLDILVATPGRLLDLINQKHVHLSKVKYFVLDEADQMLDMGMIHDVRKIITHIPHERQTMLFSATMPKEISNLAHTILKEPVKVEVTPVASTVEIINQSVYHVAKHNKINLLIHILRNEVIDSVLIFSRTKHGADKIVKSLNAANFNAQAIHGNKSQNARQLALQNFKERKIRILVATDIAARGLDIDELSHVIIYDLPEVPETYVHRIGRTGRAGLGGISYAFCDQEEYGLLKDIQKLTKREIPVQNNHPFILKIDENLRLETKKDKPKSHKGQRPSNQQTKTPKSIPTNAPHKKKTKR